MQRQLLRQDTWRHGPLMQMAPVPHKHIAHLPTSWKPTASISSTLLQTKPRRYRGLIMPSRKTSKNYYLAMMLISDSIINKTLLLCLPLLRCWWWLLVVAAKNKNILRPGIEPGSKRWQRSILPLNYRRLLITYLSLPFNTHLCPSLRNSLPSTVPSANITIEQIKHHG